MGNTMAKDGKRKILRVGIIQSGRIVEERLIRKREDVSIGQAAKNTFILPASHLPKSFTIFQGGNTGYQLTFDDTMEGRVSIGDQVVDLKGLGKSGNVKRRGNRYTVDLDDKSRGKIVVGEFTVLFQFIDAPPVLPKPQLPAAARGANVEWLFVNSLIICGLVLGGGGVGLDWWWRDTGQYLQVEFGRRTRAFELLKAEVIQKKEEEPEPEPEEEKPEEEEEATQVEAEPEPEPVKKKAPKKKEKPKVVAEEPPKEQKRQTTRSKEEIKAALKKQTVLHVLGGLGGDGEGAANTLAGGLKDSKLASAFEGGGLGMAVAGEKRQFGGEVTAVKAGGGGYKSGLGAAAGGGGKLSTKKVKKAGKEAAGAVKLKVRARAGSLGGQGGSGSIDRKAVSRVLRRRSGAVKRCYEKALKRNEGISGKISVKFKIGGAGRITKIKITSNTTGDSGVASCIKGAMKSWKFPVPEGGAVVFSFPFILSKG